MLIVFPPMVKGAFFCHKLQIIISGLLEDKGEDKGEAKGCGISFDNLFFGANLFANVRNDCSIILYLYYNDIII